MADQQIVYDFVARDDKLASTASNIARALTGVQDAAGKAGSAMGSLADKGAKASDFWIKQRKEIEATYIAMGKVPTKAVVSELDEIEKKYLELGEAAAKGNKVAADSMRKLLADAKSLGQRGALGQGAEGGVGKDLGEQLQMRTLDSGLESIKGALGGIGAALTVAHIAESIREQMTLADEMDKMAQKAGTSAAALSTLSYAGQFAGVDTEKLTTSLGKLANTAAQADGGNKQLASTFQQLGINLKDQDGNLRSTDQLLLELSARFEKMPDGAEKTALAMQLFGKSGADLIPLLNTGKDGIAAMQEEARKLGLELDDNTVANSVRFNDAMTKLDGASTGLWRRLAGQLAPTLADIAEGMADSAKEGGVVDAALSALDWTIKTTISLGATLGFVFKEAGTLIGGAAAAVSSAVSGDFAAAKRVMQDTMTDMEKIAQESDAFIKKIWNGTEGNDKPKDRKTNPYGNVVGKGAKEAEAPKSRVSEWDNELDRQKLAHEKMNAENGTFIEFSKEQERDFWKTKLDTVRMSSEERMAVEKKYLTTVTALNKTAFEARIAQQKTAMAALDKNYAEQIVLARGIAEQMKTAYGVDSKNYEEAQKAVITLQKQYNEQKRQLADLQTADQMAAANEQIELERQHSQQLLDLGLITREQMLEQESEYQRRAYELQRQALEDRAALVDPNNDPVLYAQLKNQMLEIDRKYVLAKQKIEGSINAEKVAPQKAVFDTMQSSFSKALTGMLTKATTFRQGMQNIWKSLSSVFVEEMVSKPLAEYAAGLVKKLALGQTASAAELATDTATSSAKIATSSTAAMVEGTNNAVVAGTGAASALAAIPVVGPALAAAGMPAMIALVMGVLGSVRSASGGFDIPSGMNPLTQLHQQEMVLPARYANVIRGMADQGGPGGGGDVHHHHYQINAMDARGFERVLRNNQGALQNVGKAMTRSFKNKS